MESLSRFSPLIAEDVAILSEEIGPRLKALAGRTLLVTGASGFLCSFFVDVVAGLNRLAWSSPCHIFCADNLTRGLASRLDHLAGRADVTFLTVDVSQPFELPKSVDYIVHGASIASPTFYRQFPLETIDVNAGGTRYLLDLARLRGLEGFLYLSTSEIYGDPDPAHVPTREDYRGSVSCTGPRACYDESKRLAETLCWVYHHQHNVPVKTARPFNVYGPGQRLDDRRIVPDLMTSALQRQPIVLHSDGRATRSFCYIRDAVNLLFRILIEGTPGEAYNVGNDQEIAIGDLARRVQRLAGEPPIDLRFEASVDPNYLTDNPQRRCPDLSKVKTQLGWTPRVGLDEGLERTLRHYREVRRASPPGPLSSSTRQRE